MFIYRRVCLQDTMIDRQLLRELLPRYRVRGLDRALAFVPQSLELGQLADYCIPVRVVAEEDWARVLPAMMKRSQKGDERTLERLAELRLPGTPLNGWLRRPNNRVVIKGEPGEGKTTALLLFIADACDRLTAWLETDGADGTPPALPLLLPLRQWTPGARTLAEAAARHTAQLCGLEGMAQRIEQCSALTGGAILLDGFDELDSAHVEALRELIRDTEQPVVMTARYHSDPHLVMRRHDQLRMAPLAMWMVQRFISKYFPSSEVVAGSRLKSLLRQAPGLRSLAMNPLMLSAMCYASTQRQGQVIPGTRAGVIELALRAMMQRAARKRRVGAPVNTARENAKLDLLAGLAWRFFALRPKPMPRGELVAALTDGLATTALRTHFGGSPDAFVDEIESDGIIVRHGQAPYAFLVRPFHEFCTAYRLAQMAASQGAVRVLDAATMRKPFRSWPDQDSKPCDQFPLRLPEWTEVWILSAGLAKLSAVLVQALEQEWRQAEDLVCSRLRLLTHVLGEHLRMEDSSKGESGLALELCAALFPLCLAEPGIMLPHTWRNLTARLPAALIVPEVLRTLQMTPVKDRDNLYILLGEIGSREASQELLSIFHGSGGEELTDVDMLTVAVGLGLVGDERCKEALQRRVEPPLQSSGYTPYACALGLARIGDPDCVSTIVALVRDSNTPEDLRWQIILDCGKLLGPEAEPLLLETLASITGLLADPANSPMSYAFGDACKNLELCAEILGGKGSPEAAEYLLLMLDLPMSENARKAVCSAIAACGHLEHREALRARVMHPGSRREVSNWAALALVQVGDDALLLPLLEAAADETACPEHLREAVVDSAANCAGEVAVQFLLSRLADDSSSCVRMAAAKALADQGGTRIQTALVAAMNSADATEDERQACAFSLSASGHSGGEGYLLKIAADSSADDKCRRRAIRALESTQTAVARGLLLSLWQTDESLRGACASAMAEIQRAQGWRPMPDGMWQSTFDVGIVVTEDVNSPPLTRSEPEKPLWRITLRETRTLKTKVKAKLVIKPPNDGGRIAEWDVEIGTLTKLKVAEVRWYARVSARSKKKEPKRVIAVEAMIAKVGGQMLEDVLSSVRAGNYNYWGLALQPGQQVMWEVEGSPAFHSMPWEWLRDEDSGLRPALDHAFRRRVVAPPPRTAWSPSPAAGPLSILWVTARLPGDNIGRERVLGPVRKALGTTVLLEVISDGNYLTMLKRLREHELKARYHLVHFDMHGMVATWDQMVDTWDQMAAKGSNWQLDNRSGGRYSLKSWKGETAVLLFETADNKIDPVTAGELRTALSLYRVPMMVLNSCESALVPHGDAALVAHLVEGGGFSALGFADVLTVDGAVIFFTAFYQRLANSAYAGQLDEAITHARMALHNEPLRHTVQLIDWHLPVWYAAREMELPNGDAVVPTSVVVQSPSGPAAFDAPPPPQQLELPERNARFAGREHDLEALHALLSREGNVGVVQQAGVHAQGGVGKTSVVLEYAWRCVDQLNPWHGTYPGGIFFVSCDVPDVRPAFAALARKLQVREVFSDAEVLFALKQRLEHGPPCLFVLDNVNDGEQWTSSSFREAIPGHPCKRLITTRTEQLPGVQAYRLPGMTRDDGVELLANYRPDAAEATNKDIAGDIVDWFNGLAVGLAVTGVYMALHPQMGWREFARLLDRKGLGYVRAVERELAMRQGGGSILHDYDKRVDVVFDETLSSLKPQERVTLEYAALLPEDDVPRDWLLSLLGSHLEGEDTDGSLATFAVGTIGHLTGLRLLHEIDGLGSRLGMHRVLRHRMHERLAKDVERRRDRVRLLSELVLFEAVEAYETPTSDHSLLSSGLRMLPVIAADGDPDKALNIAVYLWLTLGERLGKIKELHAAFASLRTHFPHYRTASKDVRTLLSLHLTHLGGIARALGRYQEALEHFETAAEITRTDEPDGSPMLQRLSNVALALYELGRPRESLRVYREVIRKERRKLGGSSYLCRTLSNVGMCYHSLHRFHWAEWVARCSIAQYHVAGDDDPLELAKSENNLALALLELSRFAEALPIMEKVLESEREHLDAKDPAIAGTLHNLAFCHHRMQQLDEAEARYQEAIDVAVAAYGFEHENCLLYLSNIMSLFLERDKLAAAKSACEAALRILKTIEERGEWHAEAATVYLNATRVFEALDEDTSARDMITKALDAATRAGASADAARYSSILAGLWEKAGAWAEAATAWEQALLLGRSQHQSLSTVLLKWEFRLDDARTKSALSHAPTASTSEIDSFNSATNSSSWAP